MSTKNNIGFNQIKFREYKKIFFICLILATAMFIPFLVFDKGMFIYYGDYNSQQIPFYILAQNAVKTGQTGWHWSVDLGANFVGSFSFYLLGSPFFWFTTLFPTSWVPYLLAPMLILKFAFCGLTGFAFIRRFTKTNEAAMIGAMLYAFSGFNIYNIFFNHFHEAVVVFPLLLIALEELMLNGRKGVFALAVALCAVTNYFFFFGQVVFVILYFFVRVFCGGYRLTVKKFTSLLFEAIVGVMISCLLLLPSVLAILGNPRTSEMLLGYDMVIYNKPQRIGLILQNLFFMPDPPANPIFFSGADSKWSSVSAFLPLFSLTGVITFFVNKRRNFIKVLLGICLIIALVPILNSMFAAFNWNYYARWFYMPIIFMSIATAISLEDYRGRFKFGMISVLVAILGFGMIAVIPSKIDGQIELFKLPPQPLLVALYVLIGLLMLLLLWFLLRNFGKSQRFYRLTGIMVCVSVVISSACIMTIGRARGESYDEIKAVLTAKERFNLASEEDGFYRIDEYKAHQNNTSENGPMIWGMHTIQTFQSVVPVSIMEYYDKIGQERNVASRPETTALGTRGLTSVRYLLNAKDRGEDMQPSMRGFEFIGIQGDYDVYENENFIPMGFTYDYYMDEYIFDDLVQVKRDVAMLKAILLSDEDIERYGGLLKLVPHDEIVRNSDNDYVNACNERKSTSNGTFSHDNEGFSATITLDRDNLVFYSVPYEKGWSATVNGVEAPIIKANVGFMAVKADKGDNEIRFTYKTPGLSTGIKISLVGTLLLLIYLLYDKRKIIINMISNRAKGTSQVNDTKELEPKK